MQRTPFAAIARITVSWRRIVARRPWVYWALVAVVAAVTVTQVTGYAARVERTRAGWGSTQPVLVASAASRPGDPLVVMIVDVPLALVPVDALDAAGDGSGRSVTTMTARQHVGIGEIVTTADVAGTGALALVPDGWLAVPLVEARPSGAAVGDRVHVVSQGVVIASEAIVVGQHDDVTLVAVPSGVAAAVAAAGDVDGLALLRVP